MKPKSSTINVSLSPLLEQWIAEQVASGWYNNASEVVRDGLRLLRERQEERNAKLRDLRVAIEEGMNSPTAPWEGAEEIQRRARDYHAARLSESVVQD